MDLVSFAIYLAAFFFTFATCAHLVRIFKPFQVTIGSFTAPHWLSYVFIPIGIYIAISLFIAAGRL